MNHAIRSTVWWRRVVLALLLMAFLSIVPAAFGQDVEPDAGLTPGATVTYRQTLPVNLVFVGYEKEDIDLAALKQQLPATYTPLVRSTQFYGLPGRDMGLSFDLEYKTQFTNQAFEDDYFAYLASIAESGDPTLFQTFYNEQINNVLDVTGPVWYIDGPSAEQWLMDAGRSRLGINPDKSYTIYFVNWYDRPDFRFHVYTKTDSPDPDTGHNFGASQDSRKMIAWGGTHGRTWFYDLSAGPEAWTYNYDVDNLDLDGDGVEDYRMPPIWEYTDGGYRDPASLSSDLGLVTRFVAVNLLFTTSPLYDPLVAAPGVGGRRVAHAEILEMHRKSSGLDWIDMDFVADELIGFQPYYDWQPVVERTRRPLPMGTRQAVRIATGLSARPGCWEEFGWAFAQLFCYFDEKYDVFVPEYGPKDYVAAAFGYNGSVAVMGNVPLGFADDNWRDGTQSYVFMFTGPEIRSAGYGFTTTAIHELGHHFGLSHPHDGHDSELGFDYGPGNEFFFAWSGDETHTIMSYIDVGWEFGRFDMDNMYRWEFAGYLNWANQQLGDIEAHPDKAMVRDLVDAADNHAREATKAFRRWDYLTAATEGRMAYEAIAAAAETLGLDAIRVVRSSELPPTGAMPRVIDPIRFPDN